MCQEALGAVLGGRSSVLRVVSERRSVRRAEISGREMTVQDFRLPDGVDVNEEGDGSGEYSECAGEHLRAVAMQDGLGLAVENIHHRRSVNDATSRKVGSLRSMMFVLYVKL